MITEDAAIDHSLSPKHQVTVALSRFLLSHSTYVVYSDDNCRYLSKYMATHETIAHCFQTEVDKAVFLSKMTTNPG